MRKPTFFRRQEMSERGEDMTTAMAEQAANKDGFIAALDQSGGSTPKALKLYGVDEGAWSNEAEMFDLIHQMRSRIVKSPTFTGDKVMGAILFEQTMDRDIDGTPTAQYLWEKRGVVPFLKVDKGLADEADGYVTGLEPATNFPNPRSFERSQGREIQLAGGERYEIDLALTFHPNSEEIQEVEQAIRKLTGGAAPTLATSPLAEWCAP
jgi:hypothetical protein